MNMRLAYMKILEWGRNDSFITTWRLERMNQFLSLMNPPKKARILDLGGLPGMWQLVPNDFEVTLLNLPGTFKTTDNNGKFTFVEGDGTDLSNIFANKSFDIVFSNSVIEHVGDEKKQAAFAAEVRRLGLGYWVQTPSPYFPVEAHSGVFFYWQLPQSVKEYLYSSWQNNLPDWTEMIRSTKVLSRRRMKELFPDSKFYTERKFFLEKSYAAYRPFPSASENCKN